MFASSVPSTATFPKAFPFTSGFLLGYVVGPVFWGPLSELLGRRPVSTLPLTMHTLSHVGQAAAHSTKTLLVARFFSGIFACTVTPQSNGGGVITDMWDAKTLGPTMNLFSMTTSVGLALGPVINGFVVNNGMNGRWLFWITMMLADASMALTIVFGGIPAAHLRAQSLLTNAQVKQLRGEGLVRYKRLYAESERVRWSLPILFDRTVEPIPLIMIYTSIVCGVLYYLRGIPYCFRSRHGFNAAQTGLAFVGLGLGTLVASAISTFASRHRPLLMSAMIGAQLLVVDAFWLGWAGDYASVLWCVSALSSVPAGAAVPLIFFSSLMRINWACRLTGLVALLLAPMPFLLSRYGPRIRQGSHFAPCIACALLHAHATSKLRKRLRQRGGRRRRRTTSSTTESEQLDL
ncbi:major facilitator superfamily domain-containing protein [Vararia minispora EC-137]|uniref:Major facilitator superfamily domain-containing protein n=1 Tax=Vararia minispora EC-137 TaxID=1314806 RepID=A0ACB8QAN6_9AGAM|nr:major facilitator superfamily domain-containing protein [Vararia minispora EC-137]